jgi:hypothetical protein
MGMPNPIEKELRKVESIEKVRLKIKNPNAPAATRAADGTF